MLPQIVQKQQSSVNSNELILRRSAPTTHANFVSSAEIFSKVKEEIKYPSKMATKNPQKYFQNGKLKQNNRQERADSFDYKSLNDSLKNNSQPMKIIADNMSGNVLLYKPLSISRDDFSSATYPKSLRIIDKKIAKYRKALNQAIYDQEMAMQVAQTQNNSDFEVVESKQKQLDFDFLTGIGEVKSNPEQSTNQQIQDQTTQLQISQDEPQEKQIKEEITKIILQKHQNPLISAVDVKRAFEKAYENYQNEISKQFLKKEMNPRHAMKRKNPKLYITTKQNSMLSGYTCHDEIEHNMRIYNREHNMVKPYVLVPTFQLKKDSIANSVVTYMKDYRPLINGQKQDLPKSIQNLLEEELQMITQLNNSMAQQKQQQIKDESSLI